MISLEKNEDFARAASFINQTNKDVFLTGKAGTGKTTFLKFIKESCFKNMVVIAPTGVAAINAGGVTIHSFFQLPFGMYVPNAPSEWGNPEDSMIYNKNRLMSKLRFNRSKLDLIRELELIIIDEISMVRADLLDAIDDILRAIRRQPYTPFGGVQMLYIGDLFQLPPVVKNEEMAQLSELYASPFFFSARSIQETNPIFIELKKIYRQKDDRFIDLLNKVRNNKCAYSDIEYLNSYYQPDFEPNKSEEFITIASHNAIADQINQQELAELPGKIFRFNAMVSRDFPERVFPAEKTLELKLGAQIMFIKNDKGELRKYYNGKIGTIAEIDTDNIKIKFKDEEDVLLLSREKWSNIRYKYDDVKDKIEEEELGTFEQFPIRLAWAVTIHKSQGLTFDRAIVDAGRSFAAGQVYVALSRLRSIQGLVLRSRISDGNIFSDTNVLQFIEKNADASLDAMLLDEQKEYVGQLLIRTFDWNKLLDKFVDFLEDLATKKVKERDRIALKCRPIHEAIKKQLEVANTFSRQLQIILDKSDAAQYEHLHERMNAAIQWFLPHLENHVIAPFQEIIDLAKTEKKATKFVKELHLMFQIFEKKKRQILQSQSLVDGLANNVPVEELILKLTEQQKEVVENQSIPVVKKREVGETRMVTFTMFQAGKSIEEIAKERNLSTSTIETHILQFVPSGEVALDKFVQEADQKRIIKYLENHASDTTLKEIFEAFDNEFSYMQIKAVRSWFISQKQPSTT